MQWTCHTYIAVSLQNVLVSATNKHKSRLRIQNSEQRPQIILSYSSLVSDAIHFSITMPVTVTTMLTQCLKESSNVLESCLSFSKFCKDVLTARAQRRAVHLAQGRKRPDSWCAANETNAPLARFTLTASFSLTLLANFVEKRFCEHSLPNTHYHCKIFHKICKKNADNIVHE